MIFLNNVLDKKFNNFIFSSRKKLYERKDKLENKLWIWIHTITWKSIFLKCKCNLILSIYAYWKNENNWDYLIISFRWSDWKDYDLELEIIWKEIIVKDDTNVSLLERSFLNILNNKKIWK